MSGEPKWAKWFIFKDDRHVMQLTNIDYGDNTHYRLVTPDDIRPIAESLGYELVQLEDICRGKEPRVVVDVERVEEMINNGYNANAEKIDVLTKRVEELERQAAYKADPHIYQTESQSPLYTQEQFDKARHGIL